MNVNLVKIGTVLNEIENNKIIRELICYKLYIHPITKDCYGYFMVLNKDTKLQKEINDDNSKESIYIYEYKIIDLDDKRFIISSISNFCKIDFLEDIFKSFGYYNLKLIGITVDYGNNYWDNKEEDINTYSVYFKNDKQFLEIIIPAKCYLFEDFKIPFIYIRDFDDYDKRSILEHSEYFSFNKNILFENLANLNINQIQEIFNLPNNINVKNQKGLNFKHSNENIFQIYDFDDTESIITIGNALKFNKNLFEEVSLEEFKNLFI